MKWLERFLGIKDKEQAKRTEEVAVYIHEQKNTFTSEMSKLKRQAKKVHEKTRKAHEESAKLLEVVTDATMQIAKATGNK